MGRWESESWKIANQPLFAQFNADGHVLYMNDRGSTGRAEWMMLDSGDLQITYPAGFSRKCKAQFQDKYIKLTPMTCFYGWDGMGEFTVLTKQ